MLWRRLLVPGSVVLLLLSACTHTASFERPGVAVPARWDEDFGQASSAGGTAQPSAADWWTRFGSQELEELMREALAANHELAAAAARIEQARAFAHGARSRLSPDVIASLSAARDRAGSDAGSASSSTDRPALAVSYELDLWGGTAAAARAAEARLAASQHGREAVHLVLQADVAAAYFQTLALRDRLAIAGKSLESARTLMLLVEVRFENGAASALEIAQQRTVLLGIEAQMPALAHSLRETQSALAVLLGRAPQGFTVRGRSLSDLQLPAVDAGRPAELLERRPDIRAAEASLLGAHADLAAARAALYPHVNFSASATATGWLTGGSSTLASLAASLAQTLFDGGNLRGQLALSEAARKELIERYAQTWLTSLREAQDSLSAIAAAQSRAELLRQTAQQAREAHRLAQVRYQEGSEDLLALLASQQSLLGAEDAWVQARLATYTTTADLYKALGGGWPALPVTNETSGHSRPFTAIE